MLILPMANSDEMHGFAKNADKKKSAPRESTRRKLNVVNKIEVESQ